MKRIVFAAMALFLAPVCNSVTPSAGTPAGGAVDIWHGQTQRVGHLGDAQDDFNVLGTVSPAESISSISYSLNDGPTQPLTWTPGRRIALRGDFNADIPVSQLRQGQNRVVVSAAMLDGSISSSTVTVTRQNGGRSLPLSINWGATADPQSVGQYVDGKWEKSGGGLRSVRTGYDRLFLIGNRQWQDYEVTVPVTINHIERTTAPGSGAPGLGLVMRFSGHVVGGFRNFPEAQPKWGYQPLGAIGWLRWREGWFRPAGICVFRGDRDEEIAHGVFDAREGGSYVIKMRCETLPDRQDLGVTRYSFKVWNQGSTEPTEWSFTYEQESRHALRNGGTALVAHHVDAVFGNITITPLQGSRVVTAAAGPRQNLSGAGSRIFVHHAQVPSIAEVLINPLGRHLQAAGRQELTAPGFYLGR